MLFFSITLLFKIVPMKIEIALVQHPDELDILKEQEAHFGDIKFSYPDGYILWLKEKLKARDAMQFMAKTEEEFAGYIFGSENDSWPGYYYLNDLFIHPDYQGRKVGTKLVNELAQSVKSLGFKGLVVQTEYENMPAREFYEALGFTKIDDPSSGMTYQLLFD